MRILLADARDAGKTIRMVGSGHSCTALCKTHEIQSNLDRWQGISDVDLDKKKANIRAGTKLSQLGVPLREQGLALSNMGDVDAQSLAGAVATGTHGSGPELGNFSSMVTDARLIAANGDAIECAPEKNPEIFKAVQLSLGALGIVSQIRLQLVDAFDLREEVWKEPFDDCLPGLNDQIRDNDHLQVFWSPQTDLAEITVRNRMIKPRFQCHHETAYVRTIATTCSFTIRRYLANKPDYPFHPMRWSSRFRWSKVSTVFAKSVRWYCVNILRRFGQSNTEPWRLTSLVE